MICSFQRGKNQELSAFNAAEIAVWTWLSDSALAFHIKHISRNWSWLILGAYRLLHEREVLARRRNWRQSHG